MKFKVIQPDISLGVNGGQRTELENINSKIWVHIIYVLSLLLTCYIMSDSLRIMTFKNQGQIFYSDVRCMYYCILKYKFGTSDKLCCFLFFKVKGSETQWGSSCWQLARSLPRPGPRPEPRVWNSCSSPLLFLGL